jgi:2-keto-4-pentenoate hydratase/2-oxohepta-3-ene-1,7-dioic acid hydratase in catechol pathway
VRLVTFSASSTPIRTGVLVDGGVVDMTEAGLPADMTDFIRLGDEGLETAAEVAARVAPIPLNEEVIHAPLPRPSKNVMCVGRNYRDHAAEFSRSGFDASERSVVPEHPVIFTKATTSIIGADQPIVLANDPTCTVDYEGSWGW